MTAEDRALMKALREQAMRSLIETLRNTVIEEQRQEWLADMVRADFSVYQGQQWRPL